MGIPHLSLPLRLGGTGRFVTVDQDSDAELVQNVSVILATPVGSRVEVPEFGSPRPEFGGPDLAGMAAAVEEWEPRVDLSAEVLAPVAGEESITRIRALVSPNL